MLTLQITTGIVGGGLYWLFIRFILNHKNTLARPEAERRKIKKQLYWSMAVVLALLFGSPLLRNTNAAGWIPWLVIGGYLALWAAGAYLLRSAYLVGVKKDVSSVRKFNGKAINNPEKFARAAAVINSFAGLSILLLAIAIPLFKIKLANWAPFIAIIASLRFMAFNRIEKSDET